MAKLIDKWTKEELIEILNSSETMTEACFKIGYSSYSTTNWQEITNRLKELGIDKIKASSNIERTHEEVFCENSKVSQHCLRDRFKKILSPEKCAICNNPAIWQDKPLTLRLDHINGIHNDNRLENLRWVCPNCDSQQKTYCGYNQKNKKDLNKKKYYCVDCGAEISAGAIRCVKCNHKLQYKTEHPDRETLKKLIRTLPFTTIGKQYNVSDNAVRKWCDSYGLPRKVTEIKKYSDEEWKNI